MIDMYLLMCVPDAPAPGKQDVDGPCIKFAHMVQLMMLVIHTKFQISLISG